MVELGKFCFIETTCTFKPKLSYFSKYMTFHILYSFRLPYASIFGGVGAFTKEQFEKINGFSNKFWGWGGEDDDLYKR